MSAALAMKTTLPPEGESPAPQVMARRKLAWLVALLAPAVVCPVWVMAAKAWPMVATWTAAIIIMLVTCCAVTDALWRRIFNWATYSAFLWALGINIVGHLMGVPNQEDTAARGLELGAVGLTHSIGGAVAAFFLLLFLYSMSGGGAGDVKLAAALGALFGLEKVLHVLIFSYMAAGVGLLCWIIYSVGPVFLTQSLSRRVGSLLMPERVAAPSEEQKELLTQRIPLGPFFFVGTMIVLLGGEVPW